MSLSPLREDVCVLFFFLVLAVQTCDMWEHFFQSLLRLAISFVYSLEQRVRLDEIFCNLDFPKLRR